MPFIKNFVDDFLCISKDFQEHTEHLRKLFERMRAENLTINLNKSKLCLKEIKFLGSIITSEGIKPDPEKIKKIQDFQRPRKVKQLQSFLGVVNFCSKFAKEHADATYSLLKLVKKNEPWKWSDEKLVP